MSAPSARLLAFAGFFVVTASLIPVRAEAQDGYREARNSSGDINVVGVGGTVAIDDDGSWSIDVRRVAGDFVVRSDGGGSIRYDTVKGTVRIPEKRRCG